MSEDGIKEKKANTRGEKQQYCHRNIGWVGTVSSKLLQDEQKYCHKNIWGETVLSQKDNRNIRRAKIFLMWDEQ